MVDVDGSLVATSAVKVPPLSLSLTHTHPHTHTNFTGDSSCSVKLHTSRCGATPAVTICYGRMERGCNKRQSSMPCLLQGNSRDSHVTDHMRVM